MRNKLRVEEDSRSGSKRLVSDEQFITGDVLTRLWGQLSLFRSRHSVETSYGHVEDPLFSYMNHSDKPNVIVTRDGTVRAVRIIFPGDEVKSCYTQHESCIEFPFTDAESGLVYKPC